MYLYLYHRYISKVSSPTLIPPVSGERVTDGDVALDGEGDGAVDGADQRHVNHLSGRNSILNANSIL